MIDVTDTSAPTGIMASAEEGTLISTDPGTNLALAAAVPRVANWTGAATPPSPAALVTIGQPWSATHGRMFQRS